MFKNLLTQGITTDTDNSVGTTLITLLNSSDYHTFTAISAFASTAGIGLLQPHIEKAKATYKQITIIVGVNQKSTSKEALEAIAALGINNGIFYQPGSSIFHPKIYLFEGDEKSQLIIGSSNLTEQGIFINVEASIHLELANDKPDEVQVITDLKSRFSGLFDFTDPNIQPISAELIEKFVAEKIVPTEAESKAARAKSNEQDQEAKKAVEDGIRTIFPPRKRPSVPAEFRRKRPAKIKVATAETTESEEEIFEYIDEIEGIESKFTLVWRQPKLSASHVEIPKTNNSNTKGNFGLNQGKYKIGGKYIDQITYFRQDLFSNLTWTVEKPKPYVEVATADFYVTILGEDLGLYRLEIRYKPSGEAKQRNYPTSISWGKALGKIVREKNLVGYSLNLYRLDDAEGIFKIEIQ